MAGVDTIGKGTYITNQNYSGVKIDIHNPVVNVPQQNEIQPQAQPLKIYKYQEAQIPPEYFPQMIKGQKKLPKTTTTPPALPDPKPAAEYPASVLTDKKTIPVPPPVYIEETTPSAINETVETEIENKTAQETTPSANSPVVPEIIIPEIKTESTSAVNNTAVVPEPAKTEEAKPVNQITETINTVTPEEPKPETPYTQDAALQSKPAEESTELKKIPDPEETHTKQISKVEIVPPGDTSPVLDYIKITENLDSQNYDIQALQLKEIVDAGFSKETLKPYLVEPVFHSVIDIVSKDTTGLAGPTDSQIQIRDLIIENRIAYAKQKQANTPDDKIVLPHTISEQDVNYANKLSPLELAERNKEYGITTLALLSNAFLNRVQEETGNIVAVTDVPGPSAIVNSLKSKNDTIRLSALDALIYLQREEYARELTPIYEALINTDNNTTVRAAAQFALDSLNNKKSSEQPEQITAAA